MPRNSLPPGIDDETATTKKRYNRIAPLYDIMEWFTENVAFNRWRQMVWSQTPAGRILEVGVGTGKNFPYHPPQAAVTGIDLSDRMLARARQKAKATGRTIDLQEMDAQHLDFPDNSFDAAVATFVFCSVPNPARGLQELARVVKPGGKIILLEHVRIDRPALLGKLMDWLDPLVVRIMGAHINRRTAETVAGAGLLPEQVTALARGGLVRLIVARPHK